MTRTRLPILPENPTIPIGNRSWRSIVPIRASKPTLVRGVTCRHRCDWETGVVQVSARAEYAVRAAVELARLPAHRAISAERVAMQADVPAKFLEAILTDLRHGGIVVTQRGAQGGCRLARPADQITVAEVFAAVEGTPGQVRGLAPTEVTYPDGNEAVRHLWMGVQASVLRVLSGVTLAQLADDRLPPSIARLAGEG